MKAYLTLKMGVSGGIGKLHRGDGVGTKKEPAREESRAGLSSIVC